MKAYDLYLAAKEKITNAWILANGDPVKPRIQALTLLEEAVQLDPKFAIAYCAIASVQDYFFLVFDPTAQRRVLGDQAITTALRLQPDLPEAHLGYANHLFRGYRDYERTRAELAIAKRDLPDNPEVLYLEASIDRRHEPDLAFQLLDMLAKTPYGLFYNDLKLSHYFEPLREDPRYDKLLTDLASQD